MEIRALVGVVGVSAVAAAANADVLFTFEDPGSGFELEYVSPALVEGAVQGELRTLNAEPITVNLDVIDDGSGIGFGTVAFDNISFLMSLDVGAVLDTEPDSGVFEAPVLGGSFIFFDAAAEGINPDAIILEASLTGGALLTMGSSGATITTSDQGGLVYTAGSLLLPVLDGLGLTGPADAAFTLTDISEPASVNEFGFLNDFLSNSAFTGTATLVPTPGALAVFGFAGAAALRRRRR